MSERPGHKPMYHTLLQKVKGNQNSGNPMPDGNASVIQPAQPLDTTYPPSKKPPTNPLANPHPNPRFPNPQRQNPTSSLPPQSAAAAVPGFPSLNPLVTLHQKTPPTTPQRHLPANPGPAYLNLHHTFPLRFPRSNPRPTPNEKPKAAPNVV